MSEIDIPIEAVLEHFGVKGMKWGIRKKPDPLGRTKEQRKADRVFENKAWGKYDDVYDNAATKMERLDLPGINKKYEGVNLLKKSSTRSDYHKEITTAMNKRLKESFDEVFPGDSKLSPSGKATLRIAVNPAGGFPDMYLVANSDVQHEDRLASFILDVDDNGLIVGIRLANQELTQTDISMEDFLKHYGVKGMKWGVRRDQDAAAARKRSEDHIRSRQLKRKPIHSLSNAELKFLNERLNLEQNASRLNPNKVKKGRDTAKEIVATVGVATSVLALTNTPLGKAAISSGKRILRGEMFDNMIKIP